MPLTLHILDHPASVEAYAAQWSASCAEPVLCWHDDEILPYDHWLPSARLKSRRAHTLRHLFQWQLERQTNAWHLVVAIQNLSMYLPPKKDIMPLQWTCRKGDVWNESVWVMMHYGCVHSVMSPGEYATRGQVIDLFPWNSHTAYRITLTSEQTVEQICTLNTHTQRSESVCEAITLWPGDWIIWHDSIVSVAKQQFDAYFPHRSWDNTALGKVIEKKKPFRGMHQYLPLFYAQPLQILLDYLPYAGDLTDPIIQCRWVGPIHDAMEQFTKSIQDRYQQALLNIDWPAMRPECLWMRTEMLFKKLKTYPTVKCSAGPLNHLISPVLEEQYPKQLKQPISRHHSLWHASQESMFDHLTLGDRVIHLDHGIGLYGGLKTMDIGGIEQEYIHLRYAHDQSLYVPMHQAHAIRRYGGQAACHALGSDRWKKEKEQALKGIHDVAAELLKIEASRVMSSLHMSPDIKTEESNQNQKDYQSFMDGFRFTLTSDQLKAIEDIKHDLQQPKPMDRLICGDVGFGKTEVAIHAAFLTLQKQKQVLCLVPTTILAQQHERTFKERLSDWPYRVESLSRFQKNPKQVLNDLRSGKIDVVIGTHALLQPQDHDVFQRLGLVIIDEEHRFGVRQKEMFKKIRTEVDVLSMTATPIPRTLQSAFSGMRSFSMIATPPEHRLAAHTQVMPWNERVIREAIERELWRKGQVYYVHNNIQTMESTGHQLSQWFPHARIGYAHGHMHRQYLERVMKDFYEHRIDLLVSTTIIETGIDVPSANTLIIDRADELGLAQLHQLRGRVGRSHRQAYAYLCFPSEEGLSHDAKQRLHALSNHRHLGSGFHIAREDLDIRGAGDILGASQSGHVQHIGLDLYAEYLEQTIEHLQATQTRTSCARAPSKTTLELHVPAVFPHAYIANPSERLMLYQTCMQASCETELNQIKRDVQDRFGPMPMAASHYFDLLSLRYPASELGISRIERQDIWITYTVESSSSIDISHIMNMMDLAPHCYQFKPPNMLRIQLTSPMTHASDVIHQVAQQIQMLYTNRS